MNVVNKKLNCQIDFRTKHNYNVFVSEYLTGQKVQTNELLIILPPQSEYCCYLLLSTTITMLRLSTSEYFTIRGLYATVASDYEKLASR